MSQQEMRQKTINGNTNKTVIFKWLFMAIILFYFINTDAHAQKNIPPVDGLTVVELYTTQGCPSCPKADRIFERIISEIPNRVIALSCHVPYFDSVYWKDTLVQPFCAARHGEYFHSLDLPAIYTPQLIINGKFDSKGNDLDTVRAGIQMGISLNAVRHIGMELQNDYLDISMPQIKLERPVTLWLAGYDASERVIISNGRNRGENVHYVNSMTHLTKLMNWNGDAINMAYPVKDMPADGYVVLAQYSDTTDIIAAGELRLVNSPY